MRAAVVACLLLATVRAQEGPAAPPAPEAGQPHDRIGFPVTFNDEILTRNDVLRMLGTSESELGSPAVLERELYALLRRKILELVAADLSVEVTDPEVDFQIRRQIEVQGGEAKFYEELAQRGDTLARYRRQLRHRILQEKMLFLFTQGISVDRQTLLPWRIRPTPRERRIAWEHDPERRQAGVRVRFVDFTVRLTAEQKRPLMELMMQGAGQERIREETAKLLKRRLGELSARLAGGTTFEALAAEFGVDLEAQRERWVELPPAGKAPGARPDHDFLRTARPGERSAPLPLPQGDGYRWIKLLERARPDDRGPSVPEIAQRYDRRIRELRATKWQAVMSLRALEYATLRPQRVKDAFRKQILADLRVAAGGLHELGLH